MPLFHDGTKDSSGDKDDSGSGRGGDANHDAAESSTSSNAVQFSADGSASFGGQAVAVPPGVEAYTALHLKFDLKRGDTDIAGDFRSGAAYRATFEGKPVVVKVANMAKDKYLQPEIENEERMYNKLSEIQGDVVPS
jgi:hypothetical protein